MKSLEGSAESLLLRRHKGLCLLNVRYVQLSSERTANVSFYGGTCLIMSLPAAACVCMCVLVCGCLHLHVVEKFIFFCLTSWLITFYHYITFVKTPLPFLYFVLVWVDEIKIFSQCSVTFLTFNTETLRKVQDVSPTKLTFGDLQV